jgi:hypothetical protein
MDYYDLQRTTVAVVTASVVYALYRRYNRPSVKDIPGPPSPSWVYGRLGDLLAPLFVLLTTIFEDMNGIGTSRMPVSLKSISWRTMEPWLVGMAHLGYIFTWDRGQARC